jgi:type II secretory pathway component PulF
MSHPDVIPEQRSFAYVAQTLDGAPMSGTIDAPSVEAASALLQALRLRVMRLDPAEPRRRAKPLSGEDFNAFNQQLAHLADAGMPIERGLRLIAEDMRHGGLAQSIRNVAAELERGVPLGEAFSRHDRQFPPLYGRIIDAGVRSGHLAAVLFNLGRHLQLVARLRTAIWQAAAYPLMIVAALLAILWFISQYIIPQFELIYANWTLQVPLITRIFFQVARWLPMIVFAGAAMLLAIPVGWALLRLLRIDRPAVDLLLWLPGIGPVLHKNLVARWCDAMAVAIQAGLDLPAALTLSSEVIGSPALRRDSAAINRALARGESLELPAGAVSVIPVTTLAMLQLSADRNDLPAALQTLGEMYQEQSDLRLAMLQSALGPLMILFVGALVSFAVIGVFAPILSLIQALT